MENIGADRDVALTDRQMEIYIKAQGILAEIKTLPRDLNDAEYDKLRRKANTILKTLKEIKKPPQKPPGLMHVRLMHQHNDDVKVGGNYKNMTKDGSYEGDDYFKLREQDYRIKSKVKLNQGEIWYAKGIGEASFTKVYLCSPAEILNNKPDNNERADKEGGFKNKELTVFFPFVHYFCSGGYGELENDKNICRIERLANRKAMEPLVLDGWDISQIIEALYPFKMGNVDERESLNAFLWYFLNGKDDTISDIKKYGERVWAPQLKKNDDDMRIEEAKINELIELAEKKLAKIPECVYGYIKKICDDFYTISEPEHPREYYLCKDAGGVDGKPAMLFDHNLHDVIAKIKLLDEDGILKYFDEVKSFFIRFFKDEEQTNKWLSEQGVVKEEKVFGYIKEKVGHIIETYPSAYLICQSYDEAACDKQKYLNDVQDFIGNLPPMKDDKHTREYAEDDKQKSFLKEFLLNKDETLGKLIKAGLSEDEGDEVYNFIKKASEDYKLQNSSLKEAEDEVKASEDYELKVHFQNLCALEDNINDAYVETKGKLPSIKEMFNYFDEMQRHLKVKAHYHEVKTKFYLHYEFIEQDCLNCEELDLAARLIKNPDDKKYEELIESPVARVTGKDGDEKDELNVRDDGVGLKRKAEAGLGGIVVKTRGVELHSYLYTKLIDETQTDIYKIPGMDTFLRAAKSLNKTSVKELKTMSIAEREMFIFQHEDVLLLYEDYAPGEAPCEDILKFMQNLKVALGRFGLKKIQRPYKITDELLGKGYLISPEGNKVTTDPRQNRVVLKEVQIGFTIEGPSSEKGGQGVLKTIRQPKFTIYTL